MEACFGIYLLPTSAGRAAKIMKNAKQWSARAGIYTGAPRYSKGSTFRVGATPFSPKVPLIVRGMKKKNKVRGACTPTLRQGGTPACLEAVVQGPE